MLERNAARWRKSSYSSGGANNCVQLPHTLDAVRDSKNGAVLAAPAAAVAALLTDVKSR